MGHIRTYKPLDVVKASNPGWGGSEEMLQKSQTTNLRAMLKTLGFVMQGTREPWEGFRHGTHTEPSCVSEQGPQK